MKRRDLLKGAAVLPLTALTTLASNPKDLKLIKPKRLPKGGTVAVIAPASTLAADAFDRGVKNLESLGLTVNVGKYARGRAGIFSGTDKERLADLHWAFSDPAIDAVWCVRGGYGTPRLLPDIDYGLIRKNPKIFIGFSDITALHVAIFQNTGLITFHGPVATADYTDYTKEHVLNVLMNPSSPYTVPVSDRQRLQTEEFFRTETVTPGRARGRLIGGNLSLLAAVAGTPFALKNVKGKILFIEEVDEPPYRIDRMLTQLRLSLDLKSLAGIAVGVFSNGSTRPQPVPVIDVVKDRLGDLGIPVVYGLSIGHVKDNMTLPVGIEAELDASRATLKFLETAVV